MITGTVEEISSSPRISEWTVPNFFRLPQQIDFCVYSPEFIFCQYRCRMAAQPNGSQRLPNVMLVAVYGIDKPGVNRWELEVRRSNNTVLRKCGGWKRDGEEAVMRMYIPSEEVRKGCSDRDFMKFRCNFYCTDPGYLAEYRKEKCVSRSTQTEEISRYDQLSCDIEEMLLREDFTDIIIKVEDKEYKVHKCVLAVRTPVFTSMFKHKMSENITGIVEIDDCDAVTFREFIRYLYAARVAKYAPEILIKLYRVADKYQVKELKKHCLELISMYVSVDVLSDAITLALQHDEKEFLDEMMKFFSENITEVKSSDKWQNFAYENPEESEKWEAEAKKLRDISYSKENFLQKFVWKFKGKK